MLRALVVSGAGLALIAGRRFRDWGAAKGECGAVLPGDELVPGAADVVTRAVMVDATAEQVWCWLVQIGQDRGGLYSYDWLENTVGLRIHSTDRIRAEWQQLRVGDRVRLVRPGWLGLRDGVALPVARGALRLVGQVIDPITLVMTRRMLLGVKVRAEGSRPGERPADRPARVQPLAGDLRP